MTKSGGIFAIPDGYSTVIRFQYARCQGCGKSARNVEEYVTATNEYTNRLDGIMRRRFNVKIGWCGCKDMSVWAEDSYYEFPQDGQRYTYMEN